ncbi:leucine rich repeat domain-containing protein [Ditylenchus destructor]|nr:leucine rich repeat domain-containing protein [Ditylenchus destructor]
MGREKTPNPNETNGADSHEPAEIDVVDRGINSFAQLHLNFDNQRLTRLTLSHNKLTSVPANISDLVNLENLNLWNNHIDELPTTISALPNLKILNVGMNRLNKLPRGFGSFPKLEILDLTYNNLREQSLPGNFFFMQSLRALYLGDNDFEGFPEDISHLVNLQILVLRENDLIDLPRQLSALSKLKELHIQGNRLQVIPPELGVLDLIDTKDPNAKTLRVENNPWIGPLKEALYKDGIESFWNYVRSDNYRRLYQSHPVGVGSPPPKRNKEKKISRIQSGKQAA